jgi:hypothetical protein
MIKPLEKPPHGLDPETPANIVHRMARLEQMVSLMAKEHNLICEFILDEVGRECYNGRGVLLDLEIEKDPNRI